MSTADAAVAPRRRRRRWPIVLVVVVVVLGLVVALVATIGDGYARRAAADYVRDRIAGPLGVSSPSDVSVTIGGGPLLVQALQGRLTDVTASSDDADLGGLTGRIRLVAKDVGLADRTAGSVRATVAIPNQAALRTLVGADVDSVAFSDGRLVVGKAVRFLGQTVSVSETLTVSASGGRLVFTPDRITVGQSGFDAQDLRDSPIKGLVSGITQPQSTCVNSSLPAGLGLASARIDGSTLDLVATGTTVKLGAAGKGTCG